MAPVSAVEFRDRIVAQHEAKLAAELEVEEDIVKVCHAAASHFPLHNATCLRSISIQVVVPTLHNSGRSADQALHTRGEKKTLARQPC